MKRRLLVLDPDFTLASPSMKAVLRSFPEIRAAGFEIEGWFWQCDEEVKLDHMTRIPVMGARCLRPLQALVYSVQASLLLWWRFNFCGRPRPEVIYSMVPYVAACDVAHSQFSPWDWARCMRTMGARSLREWLERGANDLIRRWTEFFLHRTTASILIVPSNAVAADFSRAEARMKIEVVPNSYDPARFHPGVGDKFRGLVRGELGLAAGDRVFAFVSTGHYRRKGFWLAVDGLAKVRATWRQAKLLVVGGQPATLEALQKQLDARHPDWREWIAFSGSTTEPERYLGAADGFLFPSWSEALALVEVEAAACGLPLFLTPHHGSEMVLRDGVNGRLLEFDADAIAAVLGEFLSGQWAPAAANLECGLDRAAYADRLTALLLRAVRPGCAA
jgi:glycosyltransferase involved in cell wall biosynthesis